MFDSKIIDLVVVLSFTYFILSLIVTAINEFIQSLLNKRGKMLEEALKGFLFDDEWKKLYSSISKSPFITSLKKTDENHPAYIPAENFSMALIHATKDIKTAEVTMESIKNYINALPESETKEFMQGMLLKSGNELNKFISEVEKYFNNAMDRVSGWYRKSVKNWVIGISIFVAIIFNIDTINLITKMYSAPDLKSKADNVSELVLKINVDGSIKKDAAKKEGNIKTSKDSIGAKDTVDGNNIDKEKLAKNINTFVEYMDKAGVPYGWTKDNYPKCTGNFADNLINWIIKLIGLFITTVALYLGAPFWFDLLSKIVNIRGTGKKPEEKK